MESKTFNRLVESMAQVNELLQDTPPEEPMVTEDDWELGPMCTTEHEECESCQ